MLIFQEVDQGSLEGWVAIKPTAFIDESPKQKLHFIIAWNEVEGKLAITCRDSHRTVSGKEERSWAGLFSLQDVRGVHDQICLVHPSIEPYYPDVPEEVHGLWSLFYSTHVPPNICRQLELYFQIALEIAGEKLLTQTLFEEINIEVYLEDVGELRLQSCHDFVNSCRENLAKILEEKMPDLSFEKLQEWYLKEESLIAELHVAVAELYNLQLQPFLDLREVCEFHCCTIRID